jgi:hypothetical protein
MTQGWKLEKTLTCIIVQRTTVLKVSQVEQVIVDHVERDRFTDVANKFPLLENGRPVQDETRRSPIGCLSVCLPDCEKMADSCVGSNPRSRFCCVGAHRVCCKEVGRPCLPFSHNRVPHELRTGTFESC